MKKIILVILFGVLFLVGCGDNGIEVVQKSDNNTITTYLYTGQVTVDSKRNTICWTYDDNGNSIKTHMVTECLDIVPQ